MPERWKTLAVRALGLEFGPKPGKHIRQTYTTINYSQNSQGKAGGKIILELKANLIHKASYIAKTKSDGLINTHTHSHTHTHTPIRPNPEVFCKNGRIQ